MSSIGQFLARRTIGLGLATGLVATAGAVLTVAGAGPASAASTWLGQVTNSGLPSGTRSVRISEGGGSACATINSGVLTPFNIPATIRAGLAYTLTTYTSTNCSGGTNAAASVYVLPADSDRADTGRDCRSVAFRYPRGVNWITC